MNPFESWQAYERAAAEHNRELQLIVFGALGRSDSLAEVEEGPYRERREAEAWRRLTQQLADWEAKKPAGPVVGMPL